MVHYNTTNQSFIYMHKILKDMGIKNNTFMLQVYDPELINIDPLNDELPQEMQARVHYEITRNIWYYFREIVRIPSTGNKLRFELNRGNMAIIWAFSLNINFSCLLPRQSYKSYTIDACYNWLTYWGSKNSNAIFIANRKPVAIQNLERVKEVSENLPKYLDLRRKFYDKDNVNRLTFEPGTYVNRIDVTASAVSEDHANKIGRGLSTREQFYDEVAFINYIQTIYSAAIYAYSTVARMAEREGESHHIIMATTAGSKLTPHGRWAYETFYSSPQFNDALYDMTTVDENGCVTFDRMQVLEYIRHSTKKFDMIHIEYMYYDLSKGDAYLEEMRKLSDTQQAFDREVLNKWDDDVEGHPLGNIILERIRSNMMEPIKAIAVDKVYFLNLYKDYEWIMRNSDHFVIGMDCSTNTGGDFSTFVVVDICTRETVATMRANNYNINRFAYAVSYILENILTKSVLVAERNSIGAAVIDIIVSNVRNPRSRIFMADDDKYGVVMTKSFRDEIMYGIVFRTTCEEFYEGIRDRFIIDEITDLVVTPKGRIDHRLGGHDDMVIGWLYAHWFISMCKTRNRYFNALLFNNRATYTDNNSLYQKNRNSISKNFEESQKIITEYGLGEIDKEDEFYGLKMHIARLQEDKKRKQKDLSVIEIDPDVDKYPELTGDPDKDIKENIESAVDKLVEDRTLRLMKNPFQNKDVQKYLKAMSNK